MRKIFWKDRYWLEGKTVYLEKSDCSYWEIGKYDDFHGKYDAINCETDEVARFKPEDLVGNYVFD